ncbi:hypothetical protein A2V56_03930 [Candidatus Woesebacteria bacterium RBG_19FT_COMBO_42_9]|uniref:Uncharacterized protein n=1 Tax=Candidatus Woesebacteria bacterium RBG_16_42_24 TaxID=1802485 RepID=A0A1F7XLP3_9BACT|nr:MAG: hypothetical protein A2V97_01435 [Candidatus Woesebacteria bacterium RBG_16_42_24]OGM17774.1 MAG: hypothetical protein A2V56_03930 [Candidatus Woesebacteria bacterium RBG_19FT_COMBO_42_9]OGM67638.1 MAG: hypothetical protein A2985_00575 [Candidatus Woesebacteria bacterium RIFCSPLOWO2_01_FULL_43_11]
MEPEGTQEVQIPSETPPSANGGESGGKKWPYVLIVIILFLLVGGAAYFLGFRNREGGEPIPTPTPEVIATPTPTEEPETTGSPTPTKKPTSTPTPTLTPTPAIQTMTITGTAALDGWRASNGGGNTTWYIQIGRNATLTERGFVSFDISSIPSGKTIDEVTLRLYQGQLEGTPYASGGSLIVDHLDYGDSLGNEDLNASAISSNIGTLTSNASIEWKDLIVTNPLKTDIAASRTRSQYRLRFTTEATGADAWARFESGDNYLSTGNRPQLVVKYH